MAHRAVLHGSHLLLIRELGARIELALVGHEGGRIHHGTGGAGVIHVRKAVAIVVRDCVVHPGAHGDEPDKLCAATSAKSAGTAAKSPLMGAGMDGDGAVTRHSGWFDGRQR